MVTIADIEVYNDGMRKSILDKIWFLNKIDDKISTVCDYGCADGSLLRMVGDILPDMRLYGYDISPSMVMQAKKNVPGAVFFTRWSTEDLRNFVLNASSVFHEIHSYSDDVKRDYNNIFDSGADYIAIRDLFYSRISDHQTNLLHLVRVLRREPADKIAEFENIHGSLSSNKNFLHYLLKYRYRENWEREVRENYFPHSIEAFLAKLPATYEIVYFEHYTLPFLRDKIQEDFGFTLSDQTHAKILLKRKGR